MVLSVCGFLEESAFEVLSNYVKSLFHNEDRRLVAEIYRPASHTITQAQSPYKDKIDDILNATRQAGRELVESMAVSAETMARIKQPIDETQILRDMGNLYWKTCIAEGITIKTFERKGMTPRPDSVETFMTLMRVGFNPQAAGETRATLQFRFSGEVVGACHFTIDRGTIEAKLGTVDKPDLAIEAPFELWMDIVTGKADGMQMFIEGKYQVEGDMSLMRMFGRKQ